MHVDDLPDDIPQSRFVWVTTTNRYLVDMDDLAKEKLKTGESYPDFLSRLCYDSELISSRGGQPIAICPSGHVMAEDDGDECGWCEAAWEAQQEARMDR